MEIHVLLTGRLGNQLFQYAFAKYLQHMYGGQIVLNQFDLIHRSGKRKKVHKTPFSYDMKEFALDSDVVLEDVKIPWYADLSNPFIRVIKKIAPKFLFSVLASKGYLLWQRPEYISIPELKQNKIFAHGYWQDVRYLSSIQNELKKFITPTAPKPEKNLPLYEIANSNNSVCISIRGGNYLNPGIRQSLFVCKRKYFIDAIKKIETLVQSPSYIIFSDDLEWVHSYINFEREFPEKKFYYEDGSDSVSEKIRLMSSCKHFIISNSSFSWWAQYLAENKNKIVIAPNAWFTNGRRCGLYMDNWILMDIVNHEKK